MRDIDPGSSDPMSRSDTSGATVQRGSDGRERHGAVEPRRVDSSWDLDHRLIRSDTDGDGTVDETSNAISVDGSTGSYTVNGLSTDTDTSRFRVELTTLGPTGSPTFSGAEISSA